MSNKKQ